MRVIHVMKSASSPRIIIFHSFMNVTRGMHDTHVMSPITVRRFIGGQGVRLITYITYITRITCITLRTIMAGEKGVGLKTRMHNMLNTHNTQQVYLRVRCVAHNLRQMQNT